MESKRGAPIFGLLTLTKRCHRVARVMTDRLERTNGAELGAYDFEGEKGFHCVTWFTRLRIGPNGETVLEQLGAHKKDGASMPNFAQFLASHVPEQIVYSDKPRDQASSMRCPSTSSPWRGS